MPSKQKQKGNAAERAVAQCLTDWWGEKFYRVPGSGNLRWKGAVWTYGDILPPESFPGILESKHYKKVEIDDILRCKSSDHNILGWWAQVNNDVKRLFENTGITVEPLLIYKANYRPRRLCMRFRFFQNLDIGVSSITIDSKHFDEAFCIVDLQEFISICPKDLFIYCAQR